MSSPANLPPTGALGSLAPVAAHQTHESRTAALWPSTTQICHPSVTFCIVTRVGCHSASGAEEWPLLKFPRVVEPKGPNLEATQLGRAYLGVTAWA
jgi:hypothetical protein